MDAISTSETFAPLLQVLETLNLDVAQMITIFLVHEVAKADSKWKGFFGM